MNVTAYTEDGVIQYFEIIAEPWEYFVLQDAVYEYGNDKSHILLDQLRAIKMNEDWFKKELKEIQPPKKRRVNIPIKKRSK